MSPTSSLRAIRAGFVFALDKGAMPLLVLAFLAGCGLDGQRTYSPTEPPPPSPPQSSPSSPASSSLIGQWRGSTSVTVQEGVKPDCLPPFLERGSSDALAAEIFTQGGPQPELLLGLEQTAIGGACYFILATDSTSVHATPYGSDAWGYDECQVKINSFSWGCGQPMAEVSISGLVFDGTFTDSSATQIRGTLQLRYRYRADETMPYATFAVTEAFTLAQVGK